MEAIFDNLPEDTSAIEEAGKMAKTLLSLKKEMEKQKLLFDEAEAAYKEYAEKTLPNYLNSISLTDLTIEDHYRIRLVEKAYMSPVKSGEKKEEWLQWLKDNGGAELVKKKLDILDPPEDLIQAALDKGYTVEENANTTSIKSLLLHKLGRKNAVAEITLDDVPKGFNLFLKNEVEIKTL